MFFFNGSLQKGLHCEFRVHAFIDDGMGDFGDRNRDGVLSAELECRNTGINAFNGHPDLLAGTLRRKTLGDETAIAVVSAMGGKASNAKVS